MRKTELNELIRTVEIVRQKSFQDIDSDFLKSVIDAEAKNPEDDDGALRDINQALKVYLAKLEETEC